MEGPTRRQGLHDLVYLHCKSHFTALARETLTNLSSQRDKHLTFEDPKANTGDPGYSTRSTQEWLDYLEDVKSHVLSQRLVLASTYTGDSQFNGLVANSADTSTVDSSIASDSITLGSSSGQHGGHGHARKGVLHKEPSGAMVPGVGDVSTGEAGKDAKSGRKRFSKRHSKNGLAAVF